MKNTDFTYFEPVLVVFTDGSIIDNGGENALGSWAFSFTYKDNYYEEYGIIKNSTSNISELTAIMKSLQKIKDKTVPVMLYSDSQYCVNAITKWRQSWENKNFRTSTGDPVKNKELIQNIYKEVDKFRDIGFQWVRGHNGNVRNERVDELCTFARTQYLSTLDKNKES